MAKPRKRGRKTLLTPEVQKRITEAVALGSTYALAAEYGGIHRDTFFRWMRDGEEGIEPYAEFYQAVRLAGARGAISSLAVVRKAAVGTENKPGEWTAAAWLLERRHGYSRHGVPEGDMMPGVAKSSVSVTVNIDMAQMRSEIDDAMVLLDAEALMLEGTVIDVEAETVG